MLEDLTYMFSSPSHIYFSPLMYWSVEKRRKKINLKYLLLKILKYVT